MFQQFHTPKTLLMFFRSEESQNENEKESILRALIEAIQNNPSAKPLGAFLLVLFQPELDRISHEVRRKLFHLKLFDFMDVYMQTRQIFLAVIMNVNLSHSPQNLAFKLTETTRNRVLYWARKQIKEEKLKTEVREDMPVIHAPETSTELLDLLVRKEIITEKEKWLLVETRVKGKTLKIFSEEHPEWTYLNVRQKRRRMEKKIREFLKKDKYPENY